MTSTPTTAAEKARKILPTLMEIAGNFRLRSNVGALPPATIYEMTANEFILAIALLNSPQPAAKGAEGSDYASDEHVALRIQRTRESLQALFLELPREVAVSHKAIVEMMLTAIGENRHRLLAKLKDYENRFDAIAEKAVDDKFAALVAERDAAAKVMEKLPKTADGVPIVPGMKLWRVMYYDESHRSEPIETLPIEGYRVGKHECGEIVELLTPNGWSDVRWSWLFSTYAAAAEGEGKQT